MSTSATSSDNKSGVISPYGGTLVDLMVPPSRKEIIKRSITKTLECSDRNACDIELLVVGGFSPERGFMHRADYEAVRARSAKFGLPRAIAASDGKISADAAGAPRPSVGDDF